ncbi:MAG: alpha/beta hydrolase [Planctomycetota bacterium]
MIRTSSVVVLGLLAAVLAGGCETREYWQEPMADRGLVIILPGIQGEDEYSYNIQAGLRRGGVDGAIVIQPWGKQVPIAGLLLNQVDKIGCRLDAMTIAGKIIAYQNEFPGKPVHVIGHSGGGAVAVFVAEGMADQAYTGAQPIDGLVLLSPSISSIYDLSKALSMTDTGILNCYNPEDIALLGVGTTVLGNLDGLPGPSAGLNGFDPLSDLDRPEKRQIYDAKLSQHLVSSYGDAHFASTSPGFVAREPAMFMTSAPRR